jgi:hypothetical protein
LRPIAKVALPIVALVAGTFWLLPPVNAALVLGAFAAVAAGA